MRTYAVQMRTFALVVATGIFSVAPAQAQQRFVPQAEGAVILDRETGLQWMRCAAGQTWQASTSSCEGEVGRFGWYAAKGVTSALGGYSDWRLPTRKELGGLVLCTSGQRAPFKTTGVFSGGEGACEGAFQRPTIDSDAFPGTSIKDSYWTSEALEGVSVRHAWVVGFRTGRTNDIAQSSPYPHVRLVRGN